MKVKKRIHIAPVGFEIDRIVIPAIEYNADKVYLLVHNNKAEDKAGAYVTRIKDELKKNKIEIRTDQYKNKFVVILFFISCS